jgi:hypothetical protein
MTPHMYIPVPTANGPSKLDRWVGMTLADSHTNREAFTRQYRPTHTHPPHPPQSTNPTNRLGIRWAPLQLVHLGNQCVPLPEG